MLFGNSMEYSHLEDNQCMLADLVASGRDDPGGRSFDPQSISGIVCFPSFADI
jgi:hypothetical protein